MDSQNNKKDISGKAVGAIVMASGVSKRFGTNKLFAQLGGKTLLEIACEKLSNSRFSRVLVLTRTEEASEYCKNIGVPVILHNYPGRNEAVRLGVKEMDGTDAIIFLQCDQPLLTEKSINNLISSWESSDFSGIHRLSFDGVEGSPVLFSKEYYEELKNLPEKKGGSFIIHSHTDSVHLVSAQSADEMKDIDTKEDLENIQQSM